MPHEDARVALVTGGARGLGLRSAASWPRPGWSSGARRAIPSGPSGRRARCAATATFALDRVRTDLETNLFGAWRLAQAFADHLRASAHGRLVNVSSGAGQITDMRAGTPAYSISKLALNGLTRMLADELRSEGVLVNAVCPGWTATEMGGGGRPIPEGARSVTWACLLDDDGPTGGFFRDGRPLPW
jgi:NAD(P)-dependent dehydrogenase (short-subunit alcohol dehydrogenase family)